MTDAIIIILLLFVIILAVKSTAKRATGSCCGTGDGEKKIKIADKDKSHYPYKLNMEIEGMRCGNCATRVHNALNSLDGVMAKVNLEKHQAEIWTKEEPNEETLENAVSLIGYRVTRIIRV